MSGKHFIGADYADFTNGGKSKPVSGVVLIIDSETSVTAGDDSGYVMRSECPFATQSMADTLLERVRGYRFQMYSAAAARLNPAAELGDAVDIGGVYGIISHKSDDGSMYPDIAAVGEEELEEDYPTEGPLTKEFNRKLGEARSFFIKKSNEITAKVEGVEKKTAEDLAAYEETVNKSLGELQSQIDGNIMTWFYNYEPTIHNEPASLWTTEAERIKHLGDVFYIVDNKEKGGQAYRWEYVGGAYRWSLIEDVEVAKALSDAAKAQDTADHKRRVFTERPTPPYDVGDLWSQGSEGDLLRCTTPRASGSYVESDWEPASKYTDDSALNTFLSERYEKDINAIKTQADQKAETWYQDADPSGAWNTDTLKAEHKGDMWYCTNSKDTHYQKFWRWSGSGWQEMTTTPPKAVFDAIDGKAQIFISTPKPPYRQGDLWFNSESDDIMTCVADRLEGAYNAGDWEKRNKYTDEGYVTSQIDLLVGSIQMSVDNGDTSSTLTLKIGETEIKSATITLNGVVTIHGLESGETVLDGGWINTDNLNLTGKITFNDFADDARETISTKSRTFYGSDPPPAYNAGDLWFRNGYTYRAQNSRSTYLASDWQRVTDVGLDEYGVSTVITNKLVASPEIIGATIRGATIYGGRFSATGGDVWLEIDEKATRGGFAMHSNFWDGNSTFGVYDGDFGRIGIRAYGREILYTDIGSLSQKVYPQLTWDFSEATVRGLKFA